MFNNELHCRYRTAALSLLIKICKCILSKVKTSRALELFMYKTFFLPTRRGKNNQYPQKTKRRPRVRLINRLPQTTRKQERCKFRLPSKSVTKRWWEGKWKNESKTEPPSTAELNIKSVFSHANFPARVPGRETKADEKPSLNAVRTCTKDELMRRTLALTRKTRGQQKALINNEKTFIWCKRLSQVPML